MPRSDTGGHKRCSFPSLSLHKYFTGNWIAVWKDFCEKCNFVGKYFLVISLVWKLVDRGGEDEGLDASKSAFQSGERNISLRNHAHIYLTKPLTTMKI